MIGAIIDTAIATATSLRLIPVEVITIRMQTRIERDHDLRNSRFMG
jgi:spore maturation protein SpmA